MRALWKGAISFGLITIPVRLYSAVQEKSLKFHLLHKEDNGRVRYKRVCSKCNKEVGWDDIIKGYEYSKDHYVTLSDEELDHLDVESIRAIDVVSFVPLSDIDPIYFNRSYYVAPENAGLKAYRLLADALEAEGQVGVAKVALRDKEHLATIRLKGDVFVLETMHWPDEIRAPEFEELDKRTEIRDNEVKMARQLIQQLSSDFNPQEFHDEYRKALEKLVEDKVAGQEVAVAEEPTEEPTKVVDLMEALKASVEEAKKKKHGGGDGAAPGDEAAETGQRKVTAS